MKKILVFSWFYPPINSSEGLVTFKLINNSKYSYDVFTQNKNQNWSYGKNGEIDNNKNVTSIFSKSKDIKEWMDDAYEYFVKNKDDYDIIMTRAMPQESHLIGLKIKKNFPDIKWIASFGDPIKDNPYQHICCSLYSYHSRRNKINRNMSLSRVFSPGRIVHCLYWNYKYRNNVKIRKELDFIETSTLKNADYIVLNNESQKKYMIHDDNISKKTFIIYHSFDNKLYPKVDKQKHEKIRFVFVGHLDDIRSSYSLLKAIKLLKEDVPNLSSKVEFLFYGEMGNNDKLYILDNDLLDVVKLKKPVSYIDSLKIMQDADWLIHIDGNIGIVNDENIFFAAKVADYFGSKTNIIGITMQEGAITDILRNSNSLLLSYSAEEIKNYLYLIVEENYSIKRNEKYIEKFNAKNVAKDFDKIIDNIK